MKSTLLLRSLFCALLLPLVVSAQGWEWQNPKPQGNNLHGICQFWTESGGTGYAVGDGGTLIHVDNAFSVYQYPDLTNITLRAVTMAGQDNAWIVGGTPGVILHTSDRGVTWNEQFRDTTVAFGDVCFVDAQHGWVVTGDWWSGPATVVRTTNGGTTWREQIIDSSYGISAVSFIDDQRGWICGYNKLLQSTDGGVNWQPLTPPYEYLVSLAFADNQRGWAVGMRSIYATTDGGHTWAVQGTSNYPYLTTVKFIDENHGWALGDSGLVLYTGDGGAHWTQQNTPVTTTLNDIHFFDFPYGQIVGDNGTMLFTNDGGAHWYQIGGDISAHNAFTRVAMATNDIGYILEYRYDNPDPGRIYCTSDGGTNWRSTQTNWRQPFNDVVPINATTAYAVGGGGGIFLTTNSGATWLPQYSGVSGELIRACFLDANTGWVYANWTSWPQDGPLLLHTTDGGVHWTALQSDVPYFWACELQFVDAQHGWIVGVNGSNPVDEEPSGHIYYTSDGGLTWTSQYLVGYGTLNACAFLDQNTGWVCGSEGLLLHTTDAGQHWTDQRLQNISAWWEITNIVFADANNGWVMGGTYVYYTTDGGVHWIAQDQPSMKTLHSIAATDAHHCWAVGDNGTILRWTGTNFASPRTELVPDKIALSAFPNPFNPQTTITFSLPQRSKVELKVFDVTGRLVTTLYEGMAQAGEHKATFDGSQLSSGLYFAQLHGNGISQTHKLVLLK